MINKIDLFNIDNNLDIYKDKLKNILDNNIKNFSNLISNNKINDKDWYLSLPFSRNTLISKLYQKFCGILLLKSIINNKNSIQEIKVGTNSEKFIIENYITDKIFIKVEENNSILFKIKKKIMIFIYFLNEIIVKLLQVIICKFTKIHAKKINLDNFILIDTYAIPNFYTKDRYFDSILDYNTDNEKIFFLPTIAYTKIINFYKVFKEFRKSKKNYLLKENYIKFIDIIKSCFFIFRVRKLIIKDFIFDGIDFSMLISDEINLLNGDHIAIEGWLNFYFFKRLKNENVKIIKLIDWWENQSTDKGMNMGVKKFFPNTPTLGYLGYVPRHLELQLLPTKLECEYNMIPEQISVIGKGVVNKIKYLNNELNVITAPAFRYNYLWEIKKDFNQSFKKILVAFPILYEDTIELLNHVKDLIKCNFEKKYEFLFKLHPTMDDNIIKKQISSYLNYNFFLTKKNIKDLLIEADLVISSKSIVCLEALSLGIPTLVFEKLNTINFNPIPLEIEKILWKVFNNSDELYKHIVYFEKRDNNKIISDIKLANQIKETYFEKINQQNVEKFIK